MQQGTASARWTGGVQDGGGVVSLGSGAMRAQPFGFATRLGAADGTDPEELAAAALAACFSMALGMVLRAGAIAAEDVGAEATVTLGRDAGGPAVTGAHLRVRVRAPGAEADRVWQACEMAKDNCPISRLFRTRITMDVAVQDPEAAPSDGAAERSPRRVAAE